MHTLVRTQHGRETRLIKGKIRGAPGRMDGFRVNESAEESEARRGEAEKQTWSIHSLPTMMLCTVEVTFLHT